MSRNVIVVLGADVTSGDVRELVESLGGEAGEGSPEYSDVVLERGGGTVWAWLDPDLLRYEDLRTAYASALDLPPRSALVLEMTSEPGSQWLAAEIVLAAADRWPLLVRDFGGEILTVEQFHRRLAKRRAGFFDAATWHDPSPAAARRGRVALVTMALPPDVTPRHVERLVRSLGGLAGHGEEADALLERGPARVWVQLADARATPPGPASVTRETLGDAPCTCVLLEVFETPGSQVLAAELVEAAAAHWPVLVRGASGQSMTVEDVRARIAMGAIDVFDP
ncbi:hypothetical protein [Microbispora sp. NBRC 16548]|uniref:hypothetical protein n=1 Tax=Microbispora sp. NBRC 16548 TaxID=3030994 RepID=UPI0025564A06|nr:hypothetical protein [Microbispora sp. NBRC 16548]